MEFGQERGAMDRAGGIVYRQDWRKKDPMDMAIDTLDVLEGDMTGTQRQWVESALYKIPQFKTFHPVGIVVGFMALNFDNKKVSVPSFKLALRCADRFKTLGISLRNVDVLRYGRRWEKWCEEGIFQSS